MPTKYRMGGMPTDAHGMNRKPPTRAAIDRALAFYAGPPPDPQKKTVDLAPTRPTAYSNIRQPQYSASPSQHQGVSHSMLLARLMPRTAAALLSNGAAVAALAQLLPVTAAALSGALR